MSDLPKLTPAGIYVGRNSNHMELTEELMRDEKAFAWFMGRIAEELRQQWIADPTPLNITVEVAK